MSTDIFNQSIFEKIYKRTLKLYVLMTDTKYEAHEYLYWQIIDSIQKLMAYLYHNKCVED